MNKAIPFLLSLLVVCACAPGKQESEAGKADSLQSGSAISDEGIFSFAVSSSVSRENLDDAIVEGFLKAFAESRKDDDTVEIIDHRLEKNSLFTAQGCMPSRILELRLNIPKEGSTVMHWYLITELPQEFIVSQPITEDITERQGSSDAVLDLGYSIDGECPVVAIKTSSEGGDIDYSSSEVLTLYSVNRGFEEILRLELDHTLKEGYYDKPDSAKVTSRRRTFEFIKSQDQTPYDIVSKLSDGTSEKTERYAWNGQAYKLKE